MPFYGIAFFDSDNHPNDEEFSHRKPGDDHYIFTIQRRIERVGGRKQ